MSNIDPGNTQALSEASREHLRAVREQLLHLHKAVLDVERASYEKVNGRVTNPHELLQLVMRDPWFGWFRPLSDLVVQIDEMLDSEELVTEGDAEVLLREVRSLLNPAEEGEEFGEKYHQILQKDPGVILAHAEISKLLQPKG